MKHLCYFIHFLLQCRRVVGFCARDGSPSGRRQPRWLRSRQPGHRQGMRPRLAGTQQQDEERQEKSEQPLQGTGYPSQQSRSAEKVNENAEQCVSTALHSVFGV
ncbi:hypothetical protein FEN99_21175 [Salmonella enterica subsp. enterica serovar Potsdam]|nr:hypothetical protein [Salmonella enterica]EBG5190007.1 hypothetical protein [Salmonella enterica subsp. enterica serovar Bareilly]EBG8147482.1 hypothetical protein [Salmonella enterica subsp. enterica serovar Typhimurium]EBK2200770.1 hypothetical protein [Salmonella enterica subsp. enterica serovar Virchow]EBZ9911474.1 hypothetical protein [Salmonella enterica subsp. enterica serovar Mikawasima]ECA5484256.1 hypothetical protein [Salmonella enterica subsp. enterica serovar Potsdam]ECF026328